MYCDNGDGYNGDNDIDEDKAEGEKRAAMIRLSRTTAPWCTYVYCDDGNGNNGDNDVDEDKAEGEKGI